MANDQWVLQPGYNPLGLHDLGVVPRITTMGTAGWQRQIEEARGYAKYLAPTPAATPGGSWPTLPDPFGLRIMPAAAMPAEPEPVVVEIAPEPGTEPIRQVLSKHEATFEFQSGDGGTAKATCGEVRIEVSGGTCSVRVDGKWVALPRIARIYQGALYVDPSLADEVSQAKTRRSLAAARARMPATGQPVLVRSPDDRFHWAGGGDLVAPTGGWQTPRERFDRTGVFWPDNAADAGMFVAGVVAAPLAATAATVAAPVLRPIQALGLAKRQWDLWSQLGLQEGTTQFLGERWRAAKEPFDLANAKSPFGMGMAAGNWMLLAYGVAGGAGGQPPTPPGGVAPPSPDHRWVAVGDGRSVLADPARLNYSRLVLDVPAEDFVHRFDLILDRHIVAVGSASVLPAGKRLPGLRDEYILFRAPGSMLSGPFDAAWHTRTGTYELGLRAWTDGSGVFQVMHRFFTPKGGIKEPSVLGSSELAEAAARQWRTGNRLPAYYPQYEGSF